MSTDLLHDDDACPGHCHRQGAEKEHLPNPLPHQHHYHRSCLQEGFQVDQAPAVIW